MTTSLITDSIAPEISTVTNGADVSIDSGSLLCTGGASGGNGVNVHTESPYSEISTRFKLYVPPSGVSDGAIFSTYDARGKFKFYLSDGNFGVTSGVSGSNNGPNKVWSSSEYLGKWVEVILTMQSRTPTRDGKMKVFFDKTEVADMDVNTNSGSYQDCSWKQFNIFGEGPDASGAPGQLRIKDFKFHPGIYDADLTKYIVVPGR